MDLSQPPRHGDLPVAVVGGGLAGLSAAVTLAGRGHAVVLFEANDWLGGKAAVLQEDGFRFDMGPTILTLPRVLDRVFAEAGRETSTELDLHRLDPQWRCFFDDGSTIDLVADVDDMVGRIEAFAPGDPSAAGYRRFIGVSERLHGISERFFFWKSVGSVRDTFDLRSNMTWATLSDLMALRMGTSFGRVVRKHLPDARIAQMVDHFAQYVGSNPFAAPAVLSSIAHMQTGDGVWYPEGGTGAVPKALAKVARELGVEFRTGTPVARIEEAGGRVAAVVTAAGERVAVKAVVSNMDAARTYGELLEPPRREALKHPLEPACSGVVFYLGLDRGYEHLAHHDFVFSRDAKDEFDHIYRRGEPAPDPTCYLAAPARTEPGVAPPGGEALYILVHAPSLRPHHDWTRMLPAYRRVVFDKLARCAGLTNLEDRIRVERVLTPQDIHDRYRVLNGAIYGVAAHGRYTGAFKPGNRRPDVPGLYLAGGAAHPGPGMPMVLMSGWIAADALDADLPAPTARPGAPAPHATMRASPPEVDPVRLRSPAWLTFFERVLTQRLRRSFHAVRLAKPGVPAVVADLPLIVYCNHPSWWDGALVPVLTARLFSERRAFGPIDAEALARYPFMRRLGLFGVDLGSYAGAATFLRVGRAVLSASDTLFCLMPEGEFRDARPRPLHLRPGLAGLISVVPRATVLPLAVEYPFWSERLPEALARFGEPTVMGSAVPMPLDDVRRSLQSRLESAMDRLADDAIARDPARFDLVLEGRAGVGGVYDAWRRLRAWRAGERFDAAHAPEPPVIAGLAWLGAALAVLPLALALANLRRFRRPSALPPAGTAVSILIPARDEADGIAEAVRGALASIGVAVEVVVLDDDSSDDTAAIVARLAAADDRVRLLCAPPLPRGWAGKQRACQLLSEAARHPVLMFVDADVKLAPDAAARAAGHLLADDRLGLVSGFPRENTGSLAEQLVVPWIHLLLLGYLPFARMQRSTSPAYAAACGQWVVVRRDAYRAVGGHAAAPASRHDGLSLPRTFRTAGWATDVFDGCRLARCRMYRDLPTVWNGFAKSAGEGLATPTALPVWTLLIGGGHVAPAVALVGGFTAGTVPVAVAGAVGVAANLALRALLCVRFRQPIAGALLHPLGAALVLAVQWTALVRHLLGRPSAWRGRQYARS